MRFKNTLIFCFGAGIGAIGYYFKNNSKKSQETQKKNRVQQNSLNQQLVAFILRKDLNFDHNKMLIHVGHLSVTLFLKFCKHSSNVEFSKLKKLFYFSPNLQMQQHKMSLSKASLNLQQATSMEAATIRKSETLAGFGIGPFDKMYSNFLLINLIPMFQ